MAGYDALFSNPFLKTNLECVCGIAKVRVKTKSSSSHQGEHRVKEHERLMERIRRRGRRRHRSGAEVVSSRRTGHLVESRRFRRVPGNLPSSADQR